MAFSVAGKLRGNPYESPQENELPTTGPAVAASLGFGLRGAATLGFFVGGILGGCAFLQSGAIVEDYVIPRMFDPSEGFVAYGQYFVLGVGPIAALVGGVTGAVIACTFCRRCPNPDVLLLICMASLAGFELLWSIPLLNSPGRHIVVPNGSIGIVIVCCLIATALSYPLARRRAARKTSAR